VDAEWTRHARVPSSQSAGLTQVPGWAGGDRPPGPREATPGKISSAAVAFGARVRCIASQNGYHYGMSKQIAIRLSDELVAFVDKIVESGRERSRAAVISRALEREQRRMVATRDAEILAATGPDPELEGLADYAAGLPDQS
jgi:Arc/MetJ-type ribon-helix-helix transcriptional regulator